MKEREKVHGKKESASSPTDLSGLNQGSSDCLLSLAILVTLPRRVMPERDERRS